MFGLILPFLGTAVGAAFVFFQKNSGSRGQSRGLTGFACGVMMAASVWSLLLPALERSSHMGIWSFFPAAFGFFLGVAFLSLLSHVISYAKQSSMLVLAVTLHNIPEGMAVGVAYAAALTGDIALSEAFVLALGIAIQNFPEGAIISMPLKAGGAKKGRAFFCGVLSGLVEPIASVLTLAFTQVISGFLPYLLAFAAGAMVYAVVNELLPEATKEGGAAFVTWGFTLGFLIMMTLDVVLG